MLALLEIIKHSNILLVNEELIDEDQNYEVLGVEGSRSGAYI